MRFTVKKEKGWRRDLLRRPICFAFDICFCQRRFWRCFMETSTNGLRGRGRIQKNWKIAKQSIENEISREGRWKTEPSVSRAGSPKTVWSRFNPVYHCFTVNQQRRVSDGFYSSEREWEIEWVSEWMSEWMPLCSFMIVCVSVCVSVCLCMSVCVCVSKCLCVYVIILKSTSVCVSG